MPGRFREIVSETKNIIAGIHRGWYNNSLMYQYNITVDTPQNAKRCWDATHHGPPYVETGPLTLMKAGYPFDFIQGKGNYIGQDYRDIGLNLYFEYDGGFYPNGYGDQTINSTYMRNVGLPGNPYDSSYGAANPYSTAAYNRFKPKIAKASLGQTIGEIRDFLPMLKTSAKGFSQVWKALGGHPTEFGPKAVAEHFVNHEFGWLPFINDMRQGYDVYSHTRKYVDHLRRSNNVWTKRGGTVLNTGDVSLVNRVEDFSGYVYPALPSAFFSDIARATGKHVTSDTYTQDLDKVWFEGRFKQYIPSLGSEDSNYHKVMNRIQLYGLRVSPTLIWKITPWTWAVDWFSNAGDIISNAEDNLFGLASLYACTMRHKTHRVVNETTLHLKSRDVACTWTQEIDSKTRHGGGPFGFELEWDDFNSTQLAILSAIGVTRHR